MPATAPPVRSRLPPPESVGSASGSASKDTEGVGVSVGSAAAVEGSLVDIAGVGIGTGVGVEDGVACPLLSGESVFCGDAPAVGVAVSVTEFVLDGLGFVLDGLGADVVSIGGLDVLFVGCGLGSRVLVGLGSGEGLGFGSGSGSSTTTAHSPVG